MKLTLFQLGLNTALFLIQLEKENSKFADTKLYILVVTLGTPDNAKLLEQLKSGFKITVNSNKYQLKVLTEGKSR